MRSLLETVNQINRAHNLIAQNDHIVIGLSGGPDSTALLLVMLKLRHKYGLSICAAHLNHQISPRQSRRYELFSEKLARRLGVPFFKKTVNLRKIADQQRRTLEETGRIERYRFFSEVARHVRANKIATAHTLDDQAETVLMRLARGAGLRGLAGIPAKRTVDRFQIIRPFIGTPKKEIFHFLKKNHESFCQDPSNRRDLFTRNRIRNRLIPWMERELNPRVKESLFDLSRICSDAQNWFEWIASKELKKCMLQKKTDRLVLDISKLKRLHRAVLSEAIFQALSVLSGGRLRFGSRHIDAICDMINSNRPILKTQLPGGIDAAKERKTLRIFDTSSK